MDFEISWKIWVPCFAVLTLVIVHFVWHPTAAAPVVQTEHLQYDFSGVNRRAQPSQCDRDKLSRLYDAEQHEKDCATHDEIKDASDATLREIDKCQRIQERLANEIDVEQAKCNPQ